jgi:hypothetical protein
MIQSWRVKKKLGPIVSIHVARQTDLKRSLEYHPLDSASVLRFRIVGHEGVSQAAGHPIGPYSWHPLEPLLGKGGRGDYPRGTARGTEVTRMVAVLLRSLKRCARYGTLLQSECLCRLPATSHQSVGG